MKWYNPFTRDYGVQYCEMLLQAMSRESGKSLASEMNNHLYYPQKGNQAYYISRGDYEKLTEAMDRFYNDEELRNEEIRLMKENGEKYVAVCKEIYSMELEKIENEELLKLYEKFLEIWIHYSSYIWTTFYASIVTAEKTEELLSKIKERNNSEESIKKLVEYASSPDEEASIMKLNKELSLLKKSFDKEKFEKLFKEFKWIPCLDIHNEPWDKKDFEEYYEDFVPSEENGITEGEIIKEFDLNEEEVNAIRINRKMAHMRDLRDEYRRIGIYHIYKIYDEIGKRMGFERKEISFMSYGEVKEFLINGNTPDKEIVNKRPDGFLLYRKNGKTFCIIEDIQEKAEELGFVLEEEKEGEIKGKIASKGIVKGKARIVLTAKDLHKVQEGEVLVSVTTGPDYVPAMHKACAFVTDEGGITCHAAIVSREMGKPCIVGTKNATHILNDGDFVEVNCETGIVRKIKE